MDHLRNQIEINLQSTIQLRLCNSPNHKYNGKYIHTSETKQIQIYAEQQFKMHLFMQSVGRRTTANRNFCAKKDFWPKLWRVCVANQMGVRPIHLTTIQTKVVQKKKDEQDPPTMPPHPPDQLPFPCIAFGHLTFKIAC